MPITEEHDLHRRRARRNILLGLVLLAFAAIVFGVTLAKFKDTLPRPAQGVGAESGTNGQ